MVNDITTCRNCGHEVTGKFCSNCGEPAQIKRVDSHYIMHELQHLLHLEKGFLYTVKEMSIRPGQNVREFINDNRNRLVKPIIFIIVTSLLYTVAIHFFHIEDGYVKYESEKVSSINVIFDWVQAHYGYANIMMGVFIALWLKAFFRSAPYNFFEILILLCFTMGMGMLIVAVIAVTQGLSKFKLIDIGGYIGVAYCAWAIGQFFNPKKIMSYVKSLIAYLLGMVTFTLLAMLLGVIIDLLKH